MNIELLNRVADQIESDPESHNQASWGWVGECQTVACIAGWTMLVAQDMGLLDGAMITQRGSIREYFKVDELPEALAERADELVYTDSTLPDGLEDDDVHISHVAAALLGFEDMDEAWRLFHGQAVPKSDRTFPEALRLLTGHKAMDLFGIPR